MDTTPRRAKSRRRTSRGVWASAALHTKNNLRKAENRIVGNLIPYLQLFAVGEKKPEKMLLKETPLEPTIET